MPRPQYSGLRSLATTAMPIFTYFALIALLFVMDPTLENGTRTVVTSERVGLPKPWHPDSIQTFAAPAPAPDMTSPLVLAAAPKAQSAPEVLAKAEPTARATRVEATPKKKRVTRRQPSDDYRQNRVWSRDRYAGPLGSGSFSGRF
jgi:hypothetical protein